jgi:sugar O-acyltransferase (sialic acid O-acetyltransferase NeuD family)
MDYKNIVVLGGGGHASVVIDCIFECGAERIHAVLDADQSLWGGSLLGVPIMGGDDLLDELVRSGVNSFVVGLGSVGSSLLRRRLFEFGLSRALNPHPVIHPQALISKWAKIGPGCQFLPGSIVNAGAVLGANVIVNSGAIVEHDCIIGDHSHVATGARLSGAVRVDKGAHIGVGSCIKQGVTIGADSIVGAGAVVVEDVAPRKVVVGVPARVLRDIV